jgi:hypothetical protein
VAKQLSDKLAQSWDVVQGRKVFWFVLVPVATLSPIWLSPDRCIGIHDAPEGCIARIVKMWLAAEDAFC